MANQCRQRPPCGASPQKKGLNCATNFMQPWPLPPPSSVRQPSILSPRTWWGEVAVVGLGWCEGRWADGGVQAVRGTKPRVCDQPSHQLGQRQVQPPAAVDALHPCVSHQLQLDCTGGGPFEGAVAAHVHTHAPAFSPMGRQQQHHHHHQQQQHPVPPAPAAPARHQHPCQRHGAPAPSSAASSTPCSRCIASGRLNSTTPERLARAESVSACCPATRANTWGPRAFIRGWIRQRESRESGACIP